VFRLRIRDDGAGVPREFLEGGRAGHFGLSGMRERARQIGGKLDIWSGAGAGTEVELNVASSIAYPNPTGHRFFRRSGKQRDGL
jgi:signal transduction histidine kinase